MDFARAVTALGALAQESRLSIFRVLVRAGPTGLGAEDVRARLGLSSTALARHMTELVDAGLVVMDYGEGGPSYVADLEVMRGLVALLSDQCCEGRPELAGIILTAPQIPLRRVRGAPPPDEIRRPSDVEIERRAFQYRDYGEVTAYRVRLTPAHGTPVVGGATPPAPALQGIHLKAAWGQTIALSPEAKPLADLSDTDLVGLCESVLFRPLSKGR